MKRTLFCSRRCRTARFRSKLIRLERVSDEVNFVAVAKLVTNKASEIYIRTVNQGGRARAMRSRGKSMRLVRCCGAAVLYTGSHSWRTDVLHRCMTTRGKCIYRETVFIQAVRFQDCALVN